MKTILVVDDDTDYLKILHFRLSSIGYKVAMTEDGEKTLTVAKEAKPDLIILDINMPKLSGYDVFRILRKDSGFSSTPVIFSSSDIDHYELFTKNKYPNALFLLKPFGNEDILEAIAKLTV